MANQMDSPEVKFSDEHCQIIRIHLGRIGWLSFVAVREIVTPAVGNRAVMRCKRCELGTPGAIILQTAVHHHDRFAATDRHIMQGDVTQSHRLQRRRTSGLRWRRAQSRCATKSGRRADQAKSKQPSEHAVSKSDFRYPLQLFNCSTLHRSRRGLHVGGTIHGLRFPFCPLPSSHLLTSNSWVVLRPIQGR